jgi:integrase/recombinase XerD
MYCLKLFFSWLEQTHQITYNPISNIQFKRPKANTRQPLSQHQIKQLFDATQNLQEKTILHLCYSCGLRRSEAVNLNLIDIDFGNNVLYVRNGKGAKRRVIPINKIVKNDLENYVKEYRKDKDLEPFMLGGIKHRISGDSLNKTLKAIIENSEISHLTSQISLHHLRHSIATHLLENGMSIEFVRDFLGHSHLETTQIYAKVRSYQIKKL